MKVKLIKFIILIFTLILVINAQTKSGNLRGIVKDATSGEILAYCNVLIKGTTRGVATDNKGYFIIANIEQSEKYQLIISYIGYKTKTIEFKVLAGKTTHLDIYLEPDILQTQVVEKIAERIQESNKTDIGLTVMTSRQLELLPRSVEADVFRALQYIPGVNTRGDVSAKYFVRGSYSNQNKVLFENGIIYNPFHALGLFSVIDPDMINNVEFFKGGFTAEHGGRMSSVLNITGKEGNKFKYSTQASASLLAGKLLVEGPLLGGSFIVTGRKTYNNKIMDKFLQKSVPIDFFDVAAKLTFDNAFGSQSSKIVLNYFLSEDNIKYHDEYKEDFYWKNNLIGARWYFVGDAPVFLNIGIGVSTFKGEVIKNKSLSLPKNNTLSDMTLDMNFSYVFDSKDEIGVGLELKEISTELTKMSNYGIPINSDSKGTSIDLFAKYKFLRFDNLGIDIGARLHAIRFLKRNTDISSIEPRINFTYQIFDFLKFKANYGLYQQEVISLENEKEVLNIYEPWIILPKELTIPVCVQYSGGIEINPSQFWNLNCEIYYKDIKDQPTLNYTKTNFEDPDFIAGQTEAYGIELLSKINYEFLQFTLAYTRSWCYNTVNKWVYYPSFDARNNINCAFDISVGNGWFFNINWVYNSGLPFTKIQSYYPKYNISSYFGSLTGEIFTPYGILDDINMGRLPDYHRLDLSITKNIDWGIFTSEANLSFINVYNRKNIFYFKRDTGERVNMLPFFPSFSLKVKL